MIPIDLPYARRGRRRINDAMRDAHNELSVPPQTCPAKRDLLNVLKSLRSYHPLGRSIISTLIVLVEKTRPEDWELMGVPFIYAHNTTLMGWTGLSRSTLQRHVRQLAEAKMLVPQDGRNGQRGRRWQGEDGEARVGFNLSSLRHRWHDLVALTEGARRHRETVSFLRKAIADVNETVRIAAEHEGNDAIAAAACRIMRQRIRTTDVRTLESHHDQMLELQQQFSGIRHTEHESVVVENFDIPEACSVEMGPMGYQNEAHYTDTKNNQFLKKVVPVAATGRDRIEAMRREGQVFSDVVTISDRSALRGFKGTALFYLEICDGLREFCTTARPSAEDLVLGAEYLSGRIGVSHHAWAQACVVLGRLQAAVCVIVMAARLERGAVIHRRDAYFRSLVERGCASKLFLDRSLYALRDARLREKENKGDNGGNYWHIGGEISSERRARLS